MNKVSITKRTLAYLIDFLILGIIISTLICIFPTKNTNEITNNIAQIGEQVLQNKINLITYLNNYSILINKYDKLIILETIFNCIFTIILYVIIPFLTNGSSIGKHILKIKIVKKNKQKATLLDYFNRAVIINFLGIILVTLMTVYILPPNIYLLVVSIFSLLEISLVIINAFMILYRQDQKGINDILTNTIVINK
ncbi:MAG: RDD family protein [Bacilli bacterium]